MSFGKRLVGAFAAVAALVAGLVGASTAYAAPDPIVLSASEAVTPGNFKAYRLTGYQDPVVASPATTPGSLSSVAPSRVSDAVENAIGKALHSANVTVSSNNPWSDTGSNSSAEADLLNLSGNQSAVVQVANYLAAHVGDPHETPVTGVAGSDTSHVDLPITEEGFYLVVDATAGGQPILVSSKITKDGVAYEYLRSQKLGVADVKTSAQSTPHKSYTNAAGQGSASNEPYVAVGDTAHFTVTMRIPDKRSYKAFTLTDTPDGYQIDQSSVKFYHRAAGVTGTGTEFHMPSGNAKTKITWGGTAAAPVAGVPNGGFVVEDHQFSTDPTVDTSGVITSAGTANSNSLIGRWSGETLVVTYDATVLKSGASNRVDSTTTDYAGHTHDNPGDNPHNGNSIPSLASMTKVSASDQNQGLEGAEFVLTDNGVTAADGPRYMKYTPATDSEMTKWIHVAAASEAVAPKLQTGSDGKISFDGLGEGTYRLHETKAPSGYLYGGVFIEDVMITVKADSSVETTPVAGASTGLYVAGDAGAAQTRDVSGALTGGQAHTFKLKNMNSIAQLPATGGAGVIAGVILVALLALIGWGSVEAGRRLRARQRQ